MLHTFHIPVLGLGYSVDTPIKVSHYGISSVISIVDDQTIERMRKHYTLSTGENYVPIDEDQVDFRSRRITAYLDLVNRIVNEKFENLRRQVFDKTTDLTRYFELLPETAQLKARYAQMLATDSHQEKLRMQRELIQGMKKGAIDVNIMSKVDKLNKDVYGQSLGDEFSDASAALRGFANSTLTSSLVLSAGMNPRLYNYLECFRDFYPDEKGRLKKQIILKVSDCRSAFIQAKYLAKRGIWISEFRIESGLNCGGHAFATDGHLLGPILEEFKLKKQEMLSDLFALYQDALAAKSFALHAMPALRITVQGGIGTAAEHDFLLRYYQVDATGWGSPFLLVPEVTNVDEQTLEELVAANSSDYYVSNSSPLGVLFNNFRRSSAGKQRLERIAKGRPGSLCKKKYLVSNTEFTTKPICTASRQYQNLKIRQIAALGLSSAEYEQQVNAVTEKLCLCEGLSNAVLMKNKLMKINENKAVSICPGPNLAWFSKVYTLDEMGNHIYGRTDLLAGADRPNMFVNELNLYVEYYQKEVAAYASQPNEKKQKYLLKFKEQLMAGIQYYKLLVPDLSNQDSTYREEMHAQLTVIEARLLKTETALA